MLRGKKLRKYLLFLTAIITLAVEIPIVAVGYLTKPVPGDVIIVLGAKLIDGEPSTMLSLRLDEAIKLYSAGYAPMIIVSGAQGRDESTSEAAAMRDYLVNHNIPPDRILMEDKSYNTHQNLANSQKIMEVHQLRRAIIVSNASHIRRSLLLAHNLGLDATGAPAPMASNTYLTIKQFAREGAAILALSIR